MLLAWSASILAILVGRRIRSHPCLLIHGNDYDVPCRSSAPFASNSLALATTRRSSNRGALARPYSHGKSLSERQFTQNNQKLSFRQFVIKCGEYGLPYECHILHSDNIRAAYVIPTIFISETGPSCPVFVVEELLVILTAQILAQRTYCTPAHHGWSRNDFSRGENQEDQGWEALGRRSLSVPSRS